MTTLLPRSAWTSSPLPTNLTPIDSPAGIAVHYTGSTSAYGTLASLAQSASRLEAERRMHVSPPRDWNDIAYNAAVDQAGRVFDLRGASHRSAANGNQLVNAAWGAVTILIGVGDTPTPDAIAGVAWWRQHVWLARWPNATKVIGHRNLYSTDCPGDPAYHLVTTGAFDLAPLLTPPEDPMPSPAEYAAAVWSAGWPVGPGKPPELAQDRLVAAARGGGLTDDIAALGAKLDALTVIVTALAGQLKALAGPVTPPH